VSGYEDSFRYDFEEWLAKRHPKALHTEIPHLRERFRRERTTELDAKREDSTKSGLFWPTGKSSESELGMTMGYTYRDPAIPVEEWAAKVAAGEFDYPSVMTPTETDALRRAVDKRDAARHLLAGLDHTCCTKSPETGHFDRFAIPLLKDKLPELEAARVEREKRDREEWIANQIKLGSLVVTEGWNPKPAWLAPKLPKWLKRWWGVRHLLRWLDLRAGRYVLHPYVPAHVPEVTLDDMARRIQEKRRASPFPISPADAYAKVKKDLSCEPDPFVGLCPPSPPPEPPFKEIPK
jgi:hypothetical protein